MANPRIEEVDDVSDPEEVDLEEAFDFARPGQNSLAPANDGSQSRLDPAMLQQMLGGGQGAGGGMPQMNEKERMQREREATEAAKLYQCLYPVYFDASRSREDGRRVRKEDAVSCPLARDIAEALQWLGNSQNIPFQVVFEPHKSHPKDWANPGRVKVLVKEDGKATNAKVKNKHHLYKLIAEYLKTHPTNEHSPLKMPIRGLPMPKDNKIPPPAIPRGFKINKILPLHSPALSGGGVSDNMMADMMKELQGAGGGGGMPGLPAGLGNMLGGGGGGGPPAQKKDKKKR